METCKEIQGNDLGYSKNAKDWAIRRRVSKAAMIGYETVSETAKASVFNEGLTNLRMLKVQSSLLGNMEGIPLGWFVFFKLMKTILAAKSKSKNDLLVHQQLRHRRKGQHYQIAGNSRGNESERCCLCVTHSSYNYRSGAERSVL